MKHFYLKALFFSFFIAPISIVAQTTHDVFVDTMSYFPYDLYIEVGDQVQFTHGGVGMHDVNFTTNSLTGQPFDNPTEIASLPSAGQWQSEAGLMGIITFDVAGTYNYDCSMYGHASMGMVGSITVNPAQVVTENVLSLQGILDLNGSGSDSYSGTYDGKAIHVRATADIADLSIFGLSVANNGGGSDGQEYTFPSMSVSAGDDILVYRAASSPSTFWTDYFGDCYSEFEHTLFGATNFPDGNGDDPVELFENGEVIDNYGDVDSSAISGDPYEDGWAYRLGDGSWLNGGKDCDVESPEEYSVLSSGCPYPLCPIPEDILGCTDSTAFNYDEDATSDDGSCVYDSGSLTNALILQGIIDFTVPSGNSDGKAIHLVATQDIADLSLFGLGVANNGDGTDGMEYSLDAIQALSGDDILIARSVEAMSAYFDNCFTEFEIVLVGSTAISQNGDDAIELYEQNILIETFGDVDVDGTGEVWEYMDSWAYKVGDSWSYGAVNCTDDSQTSESSNCPYPICSDTLIDGMGMNELDIETPHVIKMIDVLGRVHTSHKSGMVLFYIYNNGKVKGVLKE